MEYVQPCLNTTVLISISILSIFLLSLYHHHRLWKLPKGQNPSNKQPPPPLPPEASGAWPIIGHLHLLAGPKPLHEILGRMAEKHGPIFTIRTGSVHRDLVVSDHEIARECLTTNDKVFSNRLESLASKILTIDGAFFANSPYGPYWRRTRRVAAAELLSDRRLEALRHVRESEVGAGVKELYDSNSEGVLVDVKRWFDDVTLNIMCRTVVGERFLEATVSGGDEKRAERCREALRRLLELMGTFFVSDAIPWLRFLDFGHQNAMKEMMIELDRLSQRWLDDHRAHSIDINNINNDFMDVMVSSLYEDKEFENSGYDVDTIIKITSVGLIVAGKDTTTITTTWALALLLNNRQSLKKVQQELDQHVSRDRKVNESDLQNLIYLQAVVKETLRLYPALPFSSPRESTEDCTVAGHRIPAKTRLLINLSRLHRDPKVWARPDEFVPERFLRGGDHENADVRGRSFELLPFGSGRRVCPGVSLALTVTQLSLAALLHGFDVETPSNAAVDMSESVGFQNHNKSPLRVLLTPRCQSTLY